jgi:DNA modification methylase
VSHSNQLFFGDNLTILRNELADESVDLIYLDPPFNSKRDFNLLFKQPDGHASDAQITAFTDSWHWGDQAEREFAEILHHPNTQAAELIQALRRLLQENDLMAYLVMMTNRLLELHRVLKATGSLYLHCDPTASHYLKIVLDAVFGPANFRNEITWKRSATHSDAKKFANVSDTILFYSKSATYQWNGARIDYDKEYILRYYNNTDENGRNFAYDNLTKPKGSVGYFYTLLDCPPPPNGWRMPEKRARQWLWEGRIEIPPKGKTPRYKRYVDELKGKAVGNIWDDIPPMNSQAKDALGYPTQKPQTLLERIIDASSNRGDIVLDPFCGCGTAVHAAHALGRQWIGIDITHLAITLIEKRLKDAFPDDTFTVHGVPKDFAAAQDLATRDKYQFQWWACSLVNAQPYQNKKKGPDGGIDGLIFFQDNHKAPRKIVVSVKGGEHVNRAMIADLKNTVEREKAQIGLFVTLAPPTEPMRKEALAGGFYQSPHNGAFPKIQILTVAGLLNGHEAPQYPDWTAGKLTFKQAPRTKEAGQQLNLLAPD